jgi:hypothetical protein
MALPAYGAQLVVQQKCALRFELCLSRAEPLPIDLYVRANTVAYPGCLALNAQVRVLIGLQAYRPVP